MLGIAAESSRKWAFLAAVFFFFFLSFFLVLSSECSGSASAFGISLCSKTPQNILLNPLSTLVLTLLLIVALEVVRYAASRVSMMKVENIAPVSGGVSSTIAKGGSLLAIIVSLPVILLFALGGLAGAIAAFAIISQGAYSPGWVSLTFFGVLIIYALLRTIIRNIGGGVFTAVKNSGAVLVVRWELLPSGARFFIPITSFSKDSPRERSFIVPFKDVDEVRVFSSAMEAQAFIDRGLGPRVDLLIKQREYSEFLAGMRERPSVVIEPSSVGTNVLLLGGKCLYLMNLKGDVSALVDAFSKKKS
ncbi:hypothetical protein J4220_02070 [Candidatus Micrarchaeota archaeon]|nr:hypothetical protein [Candidatus Micrarchaeota archaeon]